MGEPRVKGQTPRRLRVGIAGMGVGGTQVLPAMAAMPQIELVAGADVNPVTRQRFHERYPDARSYDSVAGLCADPDVEAVWITTPNHLHTGHALEAMRAGKHVAVTKPMAMALQDAHRMVDSAHKYGVKLLAAQTSSYQVAVRAMRRVALSRQTGRVRAVHIWSYTDWMLRPRTPDELDPEQGGGIPHRQGSHQVDVVRLLGGGKLRSVRGATGGWMKERPIPGYQTAYLEFEDGTPATILHNGYGYFMTGELVPWALERLRPPEERTRLRRSLQGGADQRPEKQEQRVGGSRDRTAGPGRAEGSPETWVPGDLGLVVLSCERGDIRNSGHGLFVYGDGGLSEVDLTGVPGFDARLYRGDLEELHAAVVLGKPVYHSGDWGLATVEATLAILASARERREVRLQHQVAMAEEYDDTLLALSPGPGTAGGGGPHQGPQTD